MEVWNGIWKKILVWSGNGMKENCQYGIWKNHLPYHALIAVLGLLITSFDCTSKSLLTYRVEHGLFRPYTLY